MDLNASEQNLRSEDGVEAMSDERISGVAKLFESTKGLQEKLARLRPVLDQADHLGTETVAAFESIEKLAQSLERVGEDYRPLKEFQAELATLARDFEPIRGVQKTFVEVSETLRDHAKAVAAALDPATKLQTRLAQLAAALEPAFVLQTKFQELAETFGPSVTALADHSSSDNEKPLHSSIAAPDAG